MQTLMLTVEYDGTRYAGWKAAPKKENLDTVLGRIHTCLLYTSPSPRDRG